MRTNTAKALNVKNMVQAWLDSYGSKDLESAFCELSHQGFISTYTLNCWSDIVTDLYFNEDMTVVTNGKGEVVYRQNANGYFNKVQG